MIAKNLDEFSDRMATAIMNGLNKSEGQLLTRELLKKKLEENPNMTEAEWAKCKQEFMAFVFASMIKASPDLMKELSEHVWEELQERG